MKVGVLMSVMLSPAMPVSLAGASRSVPGVTDGVFVLIEKVR